MAGNCGYIHKANQFNIVSGNINQTKSNNIYKLCDCKTYGCAYVHMGDICKNGQEC